MSRKANSDKTVNKSLELESNQSEPESVANSDTNAIPDYCKVVRFTDAHGNTKEVLFPKNLDLDRPKRARTNFSSRQLDVLEAAFTRNQYLVGKERRLLSGQLGLSEAQIKVWYQNRRTKYKRDVGRERQHLEANAESLAVANIMRIIQHSNQRATSSVSANSASNAASNAATKDEIEKVIPTPTVSNVFYHHQHHQHHHYHPSHHLYHPSVYHNHML